MHRSVCSVGVDERGGQRVCGLETVVVRGTGAAVAGRGEAVATPLGLRGRRRRPGGVAPAEGQGRRQARQLRPRPAAVAAQLPGRRQLPHLPGH